MIEYILEKAKKITDSAEIFSLETEITEVSFESGKLKNAEIKNISGFALRIIKNGRLGFSSTTNSEKISDMLERAIESSRYGKKVSFTFPEPVFNTPDVKVYDPNIESFSIEDAINEGYSGVGKIQEKSENAKTDLTITKALNQFRILNSSGLDISWNSSLFSHYININIIENDNITWISDGGIYGNLTLKTDQYINNISNLAKLSKNKAQIKSGTFPVIITAQEMPNLVESIEMGISGKRFEKGDSPLIGKIGEKVLGNITIKDNSLLDYAPGSRPFDDEGTASKETILFENGVFKNFIFDAETASRMGYKSTGNAQRKMLSTPFVGITNMIFPAGNSNLPDMISGIKQGIIVYGALGGGQSNLIAGDFALNLMLAFLIENGEIKGKLNNTMMSGNVYSAFNCIGAMGNELKQSGSLYIPDILFDNVTISSL